MTETNAATRHEKVLGYLVKMKHQTPSSYERAMLFGTKPHDIVKYLEHPEKCGNWPFEFICELENTISKISKKYLVPFPEIELQSEEDRVLSRLLRKNNHLAFGTNTFFADASTVHHVIHFMERDPIIFEWNAYFALTVQQEVLRLKRKLLQDFD